MQRVPYEMLKWLVNNHGDPIGAITAVFGVDAGCVQFVMERLADDDYITTKDWQYFYPTDKGEKFIWGTTDD